MQRDPKAPKRAVEIEIEAVEFPSAHEAIQHSEAGGGTAIRLREAVWPALDNGRGMEQ
jgi:hypothetical protein